MSETLVVPVLAENVNSVDVVRVMVALGDTVAKEQSLIEVEASKAVVEVPSTVAGQVEEILVKEGDTVNVGQPFMRIGNTAAGTQSEAPVEGADRGGGEVDSASSEEPPSTPPQAESPASVASVADDMEQSEKAEEDSKEEPEPTAMPDAAAASAAKPVLDKPLAAAAPRTRRFARELGVDIDEEVTSETGGLVSLEDVKRRVRDGSSGSSAVQALGPLPDFSRFGPVRRSSMSGIRYATAAQVTRCWVNIPRVTHFDSADITNLESLRKKYAERAAAQGAKLTMAVMVVKAVSLALRKFPAFNASVDMEAREIVYKDYVNVGIAVATKRGLLVPVLKDADKKNMIEIASEIDALARACRDGSIGPGDLQGGTFTVTNLGRIGGSYFTPIVNYPEVAILGMGRSVAQPVVRDGDLAVGMILPLALSYDHRLIDGADAARFTRWIAEAIEEPLLLAMEGKA